MHRLCLSLLLLCSACGSSPVIEPVTDGRLLPAEFVNDQVFLVAHRNDGETLRFFTDSGGGWNAISEDAVARLGLEADESINESPAIRFPEFPEASIPRPPIDNPMEGKLFVVAS
ncbi:MAG: hypothetical protein R3270_11735, partial [Gammaproteobacteria bacterium]|nr:hypothetical protein [Gammaproteobacteria bacterium]